MKTIEELLKNLGRAEVLEFGLVTNRLPSVNIGGKFEPVDDEAPTTEVLLQMLIAMGGSRYVEGLSERPVQWTTRLDGVGVIAVAAIMRTDVVQARFTVARRDPAGGRSVNPPAIPSVLAKTQQSAAPPPVRPSEGAAPAAPVTDFRRTQQGTGGRQPTAVTSLPKPMPSPSLSPPTGVMAVPAPAKSASSLAKAAAAPALRPPEEWDDDDEPTVQTLSPPVASQGGPGESPRAKPARKPSEPVTRDTRELPAQHVPRADTAVDERKAADERKIQERIAAERAAAERAAAEQRATIERAAAERAAAADRAAAERKASGPLKVERRISTPTSVDAVDVEITTSDKGKKPSASVPAAPPTGPSAAPPAGVSAALLAIEIDPVDATVELNAPAPTGSARPVTSAMPSAVPSTTPSAIGAPEKERPRADGALPAFLGMAVAARASDLHIVAGRPVLLRVASDLLPRTEPVLAEHVERIAREIVPARLRERLEADGSCDFAIDHPQHGRFRVNASRQRSGYKLSMRVIPREIPTLASLVLPEAVGLAAKYAQGLVLITGPTGHGKSTTLAAIVDLLNRDSAEHILTLEEPIEFVHGRKRAMVSQREVGIHARSLASAFAAATREDADVIVVGELRTVEAVRLAIAASEAGHLVIATVNTPTAAKSADRIIDMFPPADQAQARASLAGVLRLIIGQRVVPSADRTRLHAAVELLPSSIALYTLIRDGRTFQIPSLQQGGRAQGVLRLDESLAELVRSQKVTLEVAKQFAESPQELDALVSRSMPPPAPRKA